MRRVVSVWFPRFPTDRLGRPKEARSAAPNTAKGRSLSASPDGSPGTPLVAVAGRLITAVDAVAAGLGLRVGMKLAQAQSLIPGLMVRDADPAGDAVALLRLAEGCVRYAPLVAVDPPDGLWIDV